MNQDDFDDLDRALFALPLETPPAGMRELILRATSQAPVPPFALGRFDIVLIGSVVAVAVWFALALVTNPSLAGTANAQFTAIARALADPTTLVWLAAGGSIAASFSFGNILLGSGRLLRRS